MMTPADDSPMSENNLLDELFDGVYMVDRERRITLWNQGAERVSGYPKSRMLGLRCNEGPLKHEDEAGQPLCEQCCPAVRVMDQGLPTVEVVYLHKADGTRLPVETHIRPIRDAQGKVVGAMEVFRDVSHWKKIEALAQEKDRLMGILAHDIRNPLTVIQAYAFLLVREPDERFREIGELLIRRSRFALALVNNLLNAQDIEQGSVALNIQELDLEQAVRDCLKNFQGLAQNKNVTLKATVRAPGLKFFIDPVRFEEMVNNLVSNALQYSPAGAVVEVLLEQDGQGAVVSVKDQGPGIKPEEQEKLFTLFGRTSNRPTGGEKSHGLGLFIVKRLVDLFGGTVVLQSQPGQGSTFIIHLPREGCVVSLRDVAASS